MKQCHSTYMSISRDTHFRFKSIQFPFSDTSCLDFPPPLHLILHRLLGFIVILVQQEGQVTSCTCLWGQEGRLICHTTGEGVTNEAWST